MLKMFRKDLSGESVDIFDNKAVSIIAPGNDVLILGVLSQGKGTSTILYVLARNIGIVFKICYRAFDYFFVFIRLLFIIYSTLIIELAGNLNYVVFL